MKADIGLIGLAVMGENLVLNLESKGYRVAVYNRSTDKVDTFTKGRANGKNIVGTYSLAELVGSLERPRKVMMMVKAGSPVDQTIDALIPLLEAGDIIIDGGNSNWEESEQRMAHVEKAGLLYIGTGVSGGEEGALLGPSIMPGGSAEAWPHVKEMLQNISAHVDGVPCCDWIGSGGAGHFVKMVHNGIEYGDMQLIGEVYDLMRRHLGLSNEEMQAIFSVWNQGRLDSYL
ncbi:MAG TPA: NAD(P)-binding domain-containing protein, partial [Sphaerochaeta sp.]|nr:NAD(P)-binding domain-containing protein [Sphaerochaeta sp.]